ncbi:DOMON-like domain-containing protein [Sphingomonas sp. MS122]|uniref:DOMON-like domain-containing protein n=1 Tax=Sphingomonas sp. MS122 TaxID=3412683 RepID=UPI003C2E4004
MTVLALTPHPDTPPAAIGAVTCSVSWQGPGSWCFDYIVGEPPEALRLPAAVAPGRADGLWRRTCFELFLRRRGEEGYFEFNFSPSGEWAAYRFDRYREGMAEPVVATPRIISTDPAQFAAGMTTYLATLGLDAETAKMMAEMDVGGGGGAPASQYALSACLDDPAFGGAGAWEAAISAVIEESDGTKSYWALDHAHGKPDFHHPDCFALELPADS